MKLLILTQKVDINDPILGFFHKWIEEFSEHFEKVTVICLERGSYELPENVKVLSLGKEDGASRLKYITRFYRHIWRERNAYDAVFVHMNPEYVVLGGIPWRLMGKRVGLWYVHRQVDLKLRLAEKLSNIIFTSTRESFGLPSAKVRYVGHGIFAKQCERTKGNSTGRLVIVSIGRITPIKRLDILIAAAATLKESLGAVEVRLIGGPAAQGDRDYMLSLHKLIESSGLGDDVVFDGELPHEEAMRRICASTIAVNLSPTGGMDKVVLESMALGIPTFFANAAFEKALGGLIKDFYLPDPNAASLAACIKVYIENGQKDIDVLQQKVRMEYSLESLIDRVSKEL